MTVPGGRKPTVACTTGSTSLRASRVFKPWPGEPDIRRIPQQRCNYLGIYRNEGFFTASTFGFTGLRGLFAQAGGPQPHASFFVVTIFFDFRNYCYHNKSDGHAHSLGLSQAASQPRQARAGLSRRPDGAGEPLPLRRRERASYRSADPVVRLCV